MHYNWAWPFLQGNSCNRARRQCHMTPYDPRQVIKGSGIKLRKWLPFCSTSRLCLGSLECLKQIRLNIIYGWGDLWFCLKLFTVLKDSFAIVSDVGLLGCFTKCSSNVLGTCWTPSWKLMQACGSILAEIAYSERIVRQAARSDVSGDWKSLITPH